MLRTSRGAALTAAVALAVSLLSALGGTAPAQAVYEPGEPDVSWGVQVPNDENESYNDVGVSGDVVWVAGTHAVNGDLLHPMLARYDLDGHLLDRKVYPDGGGWNVTNIVLDAGDWGAVVAGGADGKTFLTRYQPDGTEVWSTDLAGVDGYTTPTAVTVDGDTIVTGSTVGGQFGNWRVDSFDLTTGAHRLSRTMDGTGTLGSLVSAGGEIVVGGVAIGEMVPGEAVGGEGSYDAVLMALDPADLSTKWAHQFGTEGDDWVASLAVSGDTVYWGGNLGNDDDNPYSEAIGG
ncbi:MAG: hypothetical protein QOJ72_2099, partial [Nocardioidaceae bacterium]|nr:hypothetical protein [Nocardioidaceae bacterium]